MTEPSDSKSSAAARLRLAAAIVGLEALAVAVVAVAEFLNINSRNPTIGLTTAIFYILYAVGIGFAAWGLWRLRRWSRGPVVLVQLIQLGIGWGFRGGSTTWVTVVLSIPAIVVVAIIFAPASTELLYGRRVRDWNPTEDYRDSPPEP